MWTDKLITTFLGDHQVQATLEIESPATPETIYISFSDGSKLTIRVDVEPAPECESEVEAMALAQNTKALSWFSDLWNSLRSRASSESLDLDLL
jgi:hypothetical protein